jgi:glycosyltransferase involved in cell wall biosynthesis
VKISVVTPSFNQARYLERTLASVHAQTGPFELEHLVIDGGSSDGSVALLERWKDRLSYVSERDRGQSHALNKGMARATGDVVTWLNSDDRLLPGALAAVARFFAERPAVRWAYGRCSIIDERDAEIRPFITRYKNLLGRRYSYHLLLLENYISQPATFFRKSLYDEVGGVDEALTFDMDYDLWLRFGRIADAGIIDAELASFRFHDASKTGGQVEQSLHAANQTARRHARAIGKPWLGELNYWLYYKRTALVYKALAWSAARRRA